MLIMMKSIFLLYLFIFAALFSTSFAGRASKAVALKKLSTVTHEESESWKEAGLYHHVDDEAVIHERLLKVKTNDYGRYDPAPALVKPPFKLIPN